MAKLKEQTVEDYAKLIIYYLGCWEYINQNGCNDPFWCDGINMNLERNHIIDAKKQMINLCVATGEQLPEEYYIPTPPVVDDNYMAKNGKHYKQRIKLIKENNGTITHKKAKYLGAQLTLL